MQILNVIRWLLILTVTRAALIVMGAIGLISLLFLYGCVPGGLWVHDPSKMTPEQLEAYQKMGYHASRCATVSGGPPVSGRVTILTFPNDKKVEITYGPECAIQSFKVLP